MRPSGNEPIRIRISSNRLGLGSSPCKPLAASQQSFRWEDHGCVEIFLGSEHGCGADRPAALAPRHMVDYSPATVTLPNDVGERQILHVSNFEVPIRLLDCRQVRSGFECRRGAPTEIPDSGFLSEGTGKGNRLMIPFRPRAVFALQRPHLIVVHVVTVPSLRHLRGRDVLRCWRHRSRHLHRCRSSILRSRQFAAAARRSRERRRHTGSARRARGCGE